MASKAQTIASWYAYGALFALGHFAFVPLVAVRIARMTRAEDNLVAKWGEPTEENIARANEEEMRAWLWVHYVRTLVVDLPACVCFALGLGCALEI